MIEKDEALTESAHEYIGDVLNGLAMAPLDAGDLLKIAKVTGVCAYGNDGGRLRLTTNPTTRDLFFVEVDGNALHGTQKVSEVVAGAEKELVRNQREIQSAARKFVFFPRKAAMLQCAKNALTSLAQIALPEEEFEKIMPGVLEKIGIEVRREEVRLCGGDWITLPEDYAWPELQRRSEIEYRRLRKLLDALRSKVGDSGVREDSGFELAREEKTAVGAVAITRGIIRKALKAEMIPEADRLGVIESPQEEADALVEKLWRESNGDLEVFYEKLLANGGTVGSDGSFILGDVRFTLEKLRGLGGVKSPRKRRWSSGLGREPNRNNDDLALGL